MGLGDVEVLGVEDEQGAPLRIHVRCRAPRPLCGGCGGPLWSNGERRVEEEDSGLTWDQLRRLFGVSRRALHMWAGGAQMNSRNQERLTYLEQFVSSLGATPSKRRDRLMSSREGGGRSVFQQFVLSVSGPQGRDVEALTESTGAGRTVHGDFLFAEVIDGDQEDR